MPLAGVDICTVSPTLCVSPGYSLALYIDRCASDYMFLLFTLTMCARRYSTEKTTRYAVEYMPRRNIQCYCKWSSGKVPSLEYQEHHL